MRSVVFDSRDLDRTEEFLKGAYTKMQIGGNTEQVRVQFTRDVLATISMDELDIGFDMRYDADPLGRICLCVMHTGMIANVADGADDIFVPGDVVSPAPPDRPYRGTIRHSRCSIITFDPALLSRFAAGAASEPVRMTGHRPVSAAAGRHLVNTIAYLRDHVMAEPAIRDSPLIASTASQLLATSVLNAFATTAVTEPTSSDRRDAHPDTVRRAVEFIESNPNDDIGARDIAEAAGVTVRAVQLAFRRHLGTTPTQYLRRIRLTEAHHALQQADPASTTVTSIAASWGFHHSGRFAATYRATYGQPPSTTLNS